MSLDTKTKRIVSVSLGSSRRNHRVELNLLNTPLLVERIGTDGSIKKAISILKKLDGVADVLAMGGINLYLSAGRRRYMLRDGARIARAVHRTPLVDGTGIKDTWERELVNYLKDNYNWPRPGQTVLVSSALDRFGLSEALEAAGCKLIIGDAMFSLGLPVAFHSLRSFHIAVRITAPFLTKLPINFLYPTGREQSKTTPKFSRAYRQAEILAGDFHFLHKHLPDDLKGKDIITSTVTENDRAELKKRGVHRLVTSSPLLNGRAFGANVLEAICIALAGSLIKDSKQRLNPYLYPKILRKASLRPHVEVLNRHPF